jgi:hypothetical protein
MANTIEHISKHLHNELDEMFVKESVTGVLELLRPGGIQLDFVNAKTVKVPNIVMSALSDYSRLTGYAAGDINLTWEAFTLTQDRGKQFTLDAMDNEESGGIAVIHAMKEFERTQVIPEVDAYRLSTLAAKATGAGIATPGTISANVVISKFADAEKYFEDNEVPIDRIVYFISTEVARAIKISTELKALVGITTIEKGDIKLKVNTFNDNIIIVVPPTRFKTAYTFDNGFTPTANAKDINILAVYDAASIPVQKHKQVRTFSPEVVQDKDAWKFNYRLHHDIFVPEKKIVGVWLHTKA